MRFFILFFLAATAWAEIISEGPFSGFDLSKVTADQARALREANADFQSVASGRVPKFAAFRPRQTSEPGDVRRDHVLFFRGFRYHLSVAKMPVRVGDAEGFVFGPHLNFDQGFAIGYMPMVTQQRFYSHAELAKLLSGDSWWTLLPRQGAEVEIMKEMSK